MSGKCQTDDGSETMMGTFFKSRPKKEIDPESMLWLEKFARLAYMRAGLNFFQQDARLQTKSLQNKNQDLNGD